MARRTRSGGRPTTRKPVTLDLQAEEIKASDEEQVVAEAETSAAGEQPPEPEPVALDEAGTSKAESAETDAEAPVESEAPQDTADAEAKPEADAAPQTQDNQEPEPAAAVPPPAAAKPRNRGFSALGGGLIGGIVALLGAAGLQWGGVLPSMAPAAEQAAAPDLSPLEDQVAALQAELAALRDAPAGGAAMPADLAASVEAIQSAADAAQVEAEAAQSSVSGLGETIAALEAAMSSGAAGEQPGLEAMASRVDGLQAELAAAVEQLQSGGASGIDLSGFETQIGDVQTTVGEITQTIEGMTGELAAVSEMAQSVDAREAALSETVTALTGRIDALDQSMAEADGGQAVARALAASGLKSAVDRGLPFMAELEAFATVGGDPSSVEALRNYAAQGVPTLAQLSEQFGPVANAIVAAGAGVDQEATIADRLMSSARSLVQVRPVGEVEGDTPGAIAARIETRLQDGNLAAVVTEWETLPEAAQGASSAFIEAVQARQSVDGLTTAALNSAMAASTPSQTQ